MNTTELMQASWYEKQGEAEQVLKYGEMPIPQHQEGEVRVKVMASGVNPSDTKTRSGWGGIPQKDPRIIPHQDGAGIIDAVGEGVNHDRIGERVWLYEAQQRQVFGTASEYVVIPSYKAMSLPEHTKFTEGACLGVPAMTAHRAVLADGSVKDKFVLVTGGAGAVGNYAIQWAKWSGAKVITTISSQAKAQVAKIAGVDYLISYKNENVIDRIREITGRERGIDRVIDVDFSNNIAIADAVLRTNGYVA